MESTYTLYRDLFDRLYADLTPMGITVRPRSPMKDLNEKNRDIAIQYGKEKICNIYVAKDKYKIYFPVDTMGEWKNHTVYAAKRNQHRDIEYPVFTFGECVKEVESIVEYALNKRFV